MKQILKITVYIIFYVTLFSPMVISIFFPSIFVNRFSANTSLYFYSALLQANAAILSIVGVFYIFRIQSNQNSIDMLKNSLMADSGTYTRPPMIIAFDSLSVTEKKTQIEQNEYPKPVIPQLNQWTNLEEQIIKIKSSIKFPTCLLSAGIIVYAAGILCANEVHKVVGNLEFQILYSSFLFEVFAIYFVVKAILKAIN